MRTPEELEKLFMDIVKKQNNLTGRVLDDFEELPELFVEMFGKYPKCYYCSCTIDQDKTLRKIMEKFEGRCYVPGGYAFYKKKGESIGLDKYVDGSSIIMDEALIDVGSDRCTIYAMNDIIPKEVFAEFVFIEEEVPCEVYWVTHGQGGFGATKLTIKEADFDVKTHYNDDFNSQKVEDFVNGDSSGIEILYGSPGTGKTYYLRHLAQKYPDKKFYFMDKSTFEFISTHEFISFLLNSNVRGSVFVLEDCEILLSDRLEHGNHMLSSLLNLSDGMLGDGLHIKFICTFNAKLDKIDPAILRKGRLKYKYEFKALTPEKTAALAKELGKNIPAGQSLPVCDIYNWEEEVDTKQVTARKKVGFA